MFSNSKLLPVMGLGPSRMSEHYRFIRSCISLLFMCWVVEILIKTPHFMSMHLFAIQIMNKKLRQMCSPRGELLTYTILHCNNIQGHPTSFILKMFQKSWFEEKNSLYWKLLVFEGYFFPQSYKYLFCVCQPGDVCSICSLTFYQPGKKCLRTDI